MSFVKDTTFDADLEKGKEILYHLQESNYHLVSWLKCLEEAELHYKKKRFHDRAVEELEHNHSYNFNCEVDCV